MNAKIVYPMTIAALLAFGASTLSTAYAQDAEQPKSEEQQKPEGGSSD
jgi:hypothetical protein